MTSKLAHDREHGSHVSADAGSSIPGFPVSPRGGRSHAAYLQPDMPWPDVVRILWDIREQDIIDVADWDAVVGWLLQVSIDEQNKLAAETAIALIRDRAPDDVRSRIVIHPATRPSEVTSVSS